ncbi:MAG TPA: recombinase family protein [Candidatus Paceibacterota bacterium]|nr:recombinase family protein [Candidatus Paceibacterota bacterium]
MDDQQAQEHIRYYLYARKSSEAEDRQVASIGAQIDELRKLAQENGLNIIETFTESQSAKAPDRPIFNEMLERIRSGQAEGIICWKLDRLARNPIDGGQISWMIQKSIIKQIQTFGRVYYPTDNVLMMQVELGMANQFIIDLSVNVKRGLRAKCQMGWRPSPPPIGYQHDKEAKKGHKTIAIDPERAPIVKQIFERVAYEACSGRDIYRWLVDTGFRTRGGKRLALSRIYLMLRDPFYYGKFEYPVGSGIWYAGAHEPITTKEVFDRVQDQMTRVPRRTKGNHEFDFIKLIRCGSCGMSVCAEEKFKLLANGGKNRYVYYHCTKGIERACKEPAIREEELVRQLVTLIDRLEIDEMAAMERVTREVQRFRKFSYGVLGNIPEEKRQTAEIDTRNYAKYVLTEGSRDEKREILSCLKSRIVLHDRSVRLDDPDRN